MLSLTVVYAQSKLPNKQSAGLWTSANLKIDGKANEWNNRFQAYNHATDVFYTMANNDEELYIIVQANNPDVINKIVDGGVTLTIKKSKNDKDNMSFTYPVNDSKDIVFFNLRTKTVPTVDTSVKVADSVMMHNNKILGEKHKLIKVTGVEGVDTLISVYNENGIRATGLFDNKKVYTFEMVIKLKLIGLSANKQEKFSYQLKVNGTRPSPPVTQYMTISGGVFGAGPPLPPEAAAQVMAVANAKLAMKSVATDFWGEYLMATKP
jgi:hypothetical protein